MDQKIKALWVEELRSGKRTQAKGQLRDAAGGYCCLGVLCDIAADHGIGYWVDDAARLDANGENFVDADDPDDWDMAVLPSSVVRWAGLDYSDPETLRVDEYGQPDRLSELNDNGWSFKNIADLIERDL